jgi:D-alanyl-lipoteichoic acid acyltransferase DltB (MBOAT superfamily)
LYQNESAAFFCGDAHVFTHAAQRVFAIVRRTRWIVIILIMVTLGFVLFRKPKKKMNLDQQTCIWISIVVFSWAEFVNRTAVLVQQQVRSDPCSDALWSGSTRARAVWNQKRPKTYG